VLEVLSVRVFFGFKVIGGIDLEGLGPNILLTGQWVTLTFDLAFRSTIR